MNLIDAIEGTITYDAPRAGTTSWSRGRDAARAPRGWHLPRSTCRSTASPSRRVPGLRPLRLPLRRTGCSSAVGPYLYLPKIEHHLEAGCGTTSSLHAQEALGLPPAVRATVLIETLPAAFQMEEILTSCRDHSYGLNAGRWDYIFSMIKVFRDGPSSCSPTATT